MSTLDHDGILGATVEVVKVGAGGHVGKVGTIIGVWMNDADDVFTLIKVAVTGEVIQKLIINCKILEHVSSTPYRG